MILVISVQGHTFPAFAMPLAFYFGTSAFEVFRILQELPVDKYNFSIKLFL